MRIYIFKSDKTSGLQAFAADQTGSKLPDRLGPWSADGVVDPGRSPPHRLSRAQIEQAIDEQGFQLWRVKPTAPAD
jgi:hypothetical protein